MTDADRRAPLTPDEIVDFPLERSFRGYDAKQVDDLLDRLADQVEQLTLELQLADQRADSAEARIAEAAEAEGTLRRMLVAAQRTAEDTVAEAHEKAARILSEAEERTEKTFADLEDEVLARRAAAEQHVERLERNSEVRVAAAEERVQRLREVAGDLRAAIREQLDRHRAILDDLADVQAEKSSADVLEDVAGGDLSSRKSTDDQAPDDHDIFDRLLGESDSRD